MQLVSPPTLGRCSPSRWDTLSVAVRKGHQGAPKTQVSLPAVLPPTEPSPSWRCRDVTCQDLCSLKDAAALGSAGHGHPVGHILVPFEGWGEPLGDDLVLLQFLGFRGDPAPRPRPLWNVVVEGHLDRGGEEKDSVQFGERQTLGRWGIWFCLLGD